MRFPHAHLLTKFLLGHPLFLADFLDSLANKILVHFFLEFRFILVALGCSHFANELIQHFVFGIKLLSVLYIEKLRISLQFAQLFFHQIVRQMASGFQPVLYSISSPSLARLQSSSFVQYSPRSTNSSFSKTQS